MRHFRVFRDNFRPEAVSEVLSGVDVECVGVDVRVKLGDSTSNRSRDIRAAHFVTNERTPADGPRQKSLSAFCLSV